MKSEANFIENMIDNCGIVREQSIQNSIALNLLKSELNEFDWGIFCGIRKGRKFDDEISGSALRNLISDIWEILKILEKIHENSEYKNNIIMLMWDLVRNDVFSIALNSIEVQRYKIIGCSTALKMISLTQTT